MSARAVLLWVIPRGSRRTLQPRDAILRRHEAVAELAPDYHAILLRQHGVIVAGANMAAAVGIVEEIEQCCQIAVATALKGEHLTEEQLQAMDENLGRSWP